MAASPDGNGWRWAAAMASSPRAFPRVFHMFVDNAARRASRIAGFHAAPERVTEAEIPREPSEFSTIRIT